MGNRRETRLLVVRERRRQGGQKVSCGGEIQRESRYRNTPYRAIARIKPGALVDRCKGTEGTNRWRVEMEQRAMGTFCGNGWGVPRSL